MKEKHSSLMTLGFVVLFMQILRVDKVCLEIIDINIKDGWTGSNSSVHFPAVVPGGIYTDLLRNDIIPDPYYRFNDVECRWVAFEYWTYNATFEVTEEVLGKETMILLAEGIDTAAEIFINDKLLSFTDNMFICQTWDAKEHIEEGKNNISIRFRPPVTYAADRHSEYVSEKNYDVPPSCPSFVQHGECHVNFLRKVQSSFSWDWGPAFPTVGIWKPIRLQAFDACIVRHVLTATVPGRIKRLGSKFNRIAASAAHDYLASPFVNSELLPRGLDGTGWLLSLVLYADCTAATNDTINGTLSVELGLWGTSMSVLLIRDNNRTFATNVTLVIPPDVTIDKWWPNGFGNQTLYDLNVTLFTGLEQSSKALRIGFRTIELVQEPIQGAKGLSFYFNVNGVPIFLKGSNWIPADSFSERVTTDYLRNLLQSARDAHMNTLRVWGGGMYEQDAFYDLADELGILIWQDMMFACAMYPTDEQYLDSVKREVTQQIRRLQHHPSILIWAGNNENEAALSGNWYGTSSNFSLYKDDYIRLYVKTIQPIVEKEDPSRSYITSSPTNGVESVTEGYVANNTYDPDYGDVHFYDYIKDSWDWRTYPRPRFVSEYGFQSWPSFRTLAKVSVEEDWNFDSRFMDHRQHHLLGNTEILIGIQIHMKLPKGCTSVIHGPLNIDEQFLISRPNGQFCASLDGFKGLLYQTQVYQAMGIKMQTEYYRRARSQLIGNEGFTMGALYWQLNDIWQGASWASLEYGGTWKMLHNFAVNFFSPIMVSPFLDNDTIRAYGINDLNNNLSDANLRVAVYNWSSLTAITIETKLVTLVEQSAFPIYEASLSEQFAKANCTKEECFFHFVLTNSSGSNIGPENFIFPVSFIDAVGLAKADIKIDSVEVMQNEGSEFMVVLSTDNIAPFVWLETGTIFGRFSDNGFLMVSPKVELLFYAWQNVTAEELLHNLTITSLLDLY